VGVVQLIQPPRVRSGSAGHPTPAASEVSPHQWKDCPAAVRQCGVRFREGWKYPFLACSFILLTGFHVWLQMVIGTTTSKLLARSSALPMVLGVRQGQDVGFVLYPRCNIFRVWRISQSLVGPTTINAFPGVLFGMLNLCFLINAMGTSNSMKILDGPV